MGWYCWRLQPARSMFIGVHQKDGVMHQYLGTVLSLATCAEGHEIIRKGFRTVKHAGLIKLGHNSGFEYLQIYCEQSVLKQVGSPQTCQKSIRGNSGMNTELDMGLTLSSERWQRRTQEECMWAAIMRGSNNGEGKSEIIAIIIIIISSSIDVASDLQCHTNVAANVVYNCPPKGWEPELCHVIGFQGASVPCTLT